MPLTPKNWPHFHFCALDQRRSHLLSLLLCLAACSRRRPTSLTTTWSPCTSQIPFWTETTACLRTQATTTWTPTTFQLTDDRVPGASKLRSLSACPTDHSVHGSFFPKSQRTAAPAAQAAKASGQLDGWTDRRPAGGRGLGAHQGGAATGGGWGGLGSQADQPRRAGSL